MPILARINRATRRLWAGRAVAALLLGVAVTGITWMGLALLGRGSSVLTLACFCGALVAAWSLWQARALRAPINVGMWIEEQDPLLRYELVAVIDLELKQQIPSPELQQRASAAGIEATVARSLWRMMRLPGAAVAVVALLFLLVRDRLERVGAGDAGGDAAQAAPAASRLKPLIAVVTPPYYARQPVARMQEPERISALTGSRLVLHGHGAPDGVTAVADRDSLRAERDGAGWALAVVLPSTPGVLRLQDREYSRLITLDPVTDSVPELILTAPERDTTYQTLPARPLRLVASARDDIGLGRAYWELLITTGSGEQFETITRNVGQRRLDGDARAELRLDIRLDTFKLTPGSVINLRAIAFDRNDVSGPGRGVSETRTIRLAAVIDSTGVAAEPAIPIDSMWMSQRLLNLRTDTLLLERRRLARTDFTSRSANLSNGQEAIRGRVLAVIAVLEDDGVGGTSETEDSRLLRQAADAMQEARFMLAVAEADSARPHMRRALAILDQIRTAKRYHLRGVIRPTPVDIATVRLTGTERGAPVTANPLAPLPASDREIARRVEQGGRLHASDPAAALDSLTVLQAELLRRRPDVATLLAGALTQLRNGTPAAAALGAVRRQVASRPVLIGGSSAWTGSGER